MGLRKRLAKTKIHKKKREKAETKDFFEKNRYFIGGGNTCLHVQDQPFF